MDLFVLRTWGAESIIDELKKKEEVEEEKDDKKKEQKKN